MEKEKICSSCQEEINLGVDKYVLLGTYKGDNILDESYFHFQCFQKWYNSKIMEKTKNTIQDATKKVAGMFGSMRKMAVSQNSNGDQGYIDFSSEIPNMENEMPNMDVELGEINNKNKKDGKRNRKTN